MTPELIFNGIVTLGAVVGGIKISMNGVHKQLNRLEEGQKDVKETLVSHGERLTRVETCVELMHPEE